MLMMAAIAEKARYRKKNKLYMHDKDKIKNPALKQNGVLKIKRMYYSATTSKLTVAETSLNKRTFAL